MGCESSAPVEAQKGSSAAPSKAAAPAPAAQAAAAPAAAATTGLPEELLAMETYVKEFARDEDKDGVNDLLQASNSNKSGAGGHHHNKSHDKSASKAAPASSASKDAGSSATTGLPEELLAMETYVKEFARDEDKDGVNDLLQQDKPDAHHHKHKSQDKKNGADKKPSETSGLPEELLAMETYVKEFARDEDKDGVNDLLQEA